MENNENNKYKYVNPYTGKTMYIDLPICSKYDYLLEKNKNYMNYIALSDEFNRKVTFEELHTRIEEYARALYKKGIREGDIVGICLINTIESVYVLYALDIIGAIVPGLSLFNNEFKMQRDIEMVMPSKIITIDKMYDTMKKSCEDLKIIPITYSLTETQNVNKNDLKYIVEEGKDSNFEKATYVANQLTDILFTGGTSGTHKGVELTSSGLNCNALAQGMVWDLKPGMVHLGNVPFGHMVFGRSVLHYALCNNIEYALTLKSMPKDFYDELVRTQANGAMGGPIHWESLIDNPNIKPGSLKNLIQATSGGEMFKPEKRKQSQEALRKGGSPAIIGDGLGITEMWAPTHINVGGKNTPNTVGYQIPFVKTKLVDPKMLNNLDSKKQYELEEVPVGTVGQMLVNGPGMMLGYYNNIEETNKVFIYDNNGEKWYDTGDLMIKCGMNNNEYKFAGRKKRNFVCGVDNIYPEQIEALLLQIPEINEAAITPVPDDKYQFLPSYHISLKQETNTDIVKNKIEVLIESTLGASALPGYIEYYYEPLPRTDRNKIDVTLLKNLDMKKLETNNLKLSRKIY